MLFFPSIFLSSMLFDFACVCCVFLFFLSFLEILFRPPDDAANAHQPRETGLLCVCVLSAAVFFVILQKPKRKRKHGKSSKIYGLRI